MKSFILYLLIKKMDEDYDVDYEDDNFFEDDYYNQYEAGNQFSNPSSNALYQVLPQSALFKQLIQAVEQAITMTALPFGWSLLLLREFKWNVDYLPEYFQKPQFYKKRISFNEKLKNVSEIG